MYHNWDITEEIEKRKRRMNYGIRFAVEYLEKRLGKRIGKQILYIILLVFGVKREVIKETIGYSATTIAKYEKAIKEEKIEGIFEQKYNCRASELEKYREKIEAEFDVRPPRTRREAQVRIKMMTGIERGLTQIGEFLKKKAYKRRSVGFLPGKADMTEQRQFLETVLRPVIEQAKSGLCELFF